MQQTDGRSETRMNVNQYTLKWDDKERFQVRLI